MIEAEVTRYLAGVVAQAPELFGPPPAGWPLHGWGVVLRSKGYQTPHFHPGGIVSGVYYVRVPEAVRSSRDREAGFIRLGQPETPRSGTRLPQADLTTSIKPAEGLMILFPSYFWHNTVPFESDEDRICIAFDVLPQRSSTIPA